DGRIHCDRRAGGNLRCPKCVRDEQSIHAARGDRPRSTEPASLLRHRRARARHLQPRHLRPAPDASLRLQRRCDLGRSRRFPRPRRRATGRDRGRPDHASRGHVPVVPGAHHGDRDRLVSRSEPRERDDCDQPYLVAAVHATASRPGARGERTAIHRSGALARRKKAADHLPLHPPEHARSRAHQGERRLQLRDPDHLEPQLPRRRRPAAVARTRRDGDRRPSLSAHVVVVFDVSESRHLHSRSLAQSRQRRHSRPSRPRRPGAVVEKRAEEMPLLHVDGLQTFFSTRRGTVHAVDSVSFDVEVGETVGLVGESGCGKSVTALTIMRLLRMPPARVAAGSVVFEGRDLLRLRDSEMRRLRGNRLAMVFQDPMTSLNPVVPIGRQLAETLVVHLDLSKSEARNRAGELLEHVGLPAAMQRLKDYPHQLSGGMRQRVMIAMALACSPRLVLADEITTALDVTVQAQILDLLRSLAKELGTAFVLITHDLGVVAGMTQRVNVMYAGEIVEMALTPELFANPQMPYTWGLLGSMPRLDEERRTRLTAIPGLPPDLLSPPTGCRFADRCRYAREICRAKKPELLPVSDSNEHAARCWGTQSVPGGGWLKGVNWRDIEQEKAATAVAGI